MNYRRLSCVLTKDQVETAKGNELVRHIILKSEWTPPPEDMGVTTATGIPEESGSTTTTTTTVEAEKITDIEQIRSMLIAFVEENELDAKLVSDDNYPEYYGTVVIEFNSNSDANRSILFFAKQNNIDIDCLSFVPCVNGIPMPGGEISIITDIQQIRDMLTVFINDNNLDAKVVSDEKYPQYSGTVVIEFSSDTNADREILEYAVKNSIERTQINLIPCIDGKPITTVNPDAENTTTTTTTTEAEKITDIEQIRSMLIAFVEENGLDARIVSDKEYPGYRPIVVEFNLDAEMNAWAVLSDYIEEQNIDKHPINVVPIVDGKPMTTATADVENTTTTTTTTTTDGTNADLPQTGNNSVTNILISLAALLLTAAGAGIVYSSRILRRKEDEK